MEPVTELTVPDQIRLEDDVAKTAEAIVAEALLLIDGGLSTVSDRKLISSSEVTDLLLDVRAVLNA